MVVRLSTAAIQNSLLTLQADWSLNRKMDHLHRKFSFSNYYQTMAFANSVAWIAHQNDHHPEMVIGYKTCKVIYSTHSVNGLSELDFHCARALDELMNL